MRTRLRRMEGRQKNLVDREPVFFTLVDGCYYRGFISSDEASSAEPAEPAELERLSYQVDKLVIVIDLDYYKNGETLDV